MGLRRTAAVAITTLAALAAVPAAQAASAGSGAPPSGGTAADPVPLSIELGEVRCQDLSGIVATLPWLDTQIGQDGSRVPTVQFTIRGTRDAESVPYTVTANGERKSTGIVGSGGIVSSGIELPNNTDVRILITSDNTVVLDRTVMTNC
ncbi:hypothetical protein [Haloactinomyces albus]|uniref:Uncharacterized protein n=1 Tax=Haloactinomyces albus TaxID=1352928 RepID=A0AAE3ZC44_9ACTN|nr:hypothetical protein [Haloactinomyces albus]MDR7302181.1 hypothetical protein [Haloactinomyces albus]